MFAYGFPSRSISLSVRVKATIASLKTRRKRLTARCDFSLFSQTAMFFALVSVELCPGRLLNWLNIA